MEAPDDMRGCCLPSVVERGIVIYETHWEVTRPAMPHFCGQNARTPMRSVFSHRYSVTRPSVAQEHRMFA